MKRKILTLFISLSIAGGCASTTESGEVGVNRKQLLIVPSDQINSMSFQQYDQMKVQAQRQGMLDKNPQQLERIKKIANRLIPETGIFKKEATAWPWEAHVLNSPELNAFCMPGGKIMFFSGIIEKLNLTDAEIAAIMGHEMAHALREHSRERMSQELLKQGFLTAGVMSGKIDQRRAQYGAMLLALTVSLPHGRGQETEADEIGLELMARAGYDPRAAVSLWKKMSAQGGSKPPEILSTHPNDSKRMSNLESLLPKVLPLYRKSASLN